MKEETIDKLLRISIITIVILLVCITLENAIIHYQIVKRFTRIEKQLEQKK